MSVLDLGNGSETALASDIECFWISSDNANPNPSSLYDPNAFNEGLSMQAQHSVPASLASASTLPSSTPSSSYPLHHQEVPRAPQTQEEEEEEALEFGLGVADPFSQASGAAGLLSRPTLSMRPSTFSIPSYPSALPEPYPSALPEPWPAPFHPHDDPGLLEQESSHQVEMPWWAYGPQGMQLWFPSSLSTPLVTPWGLKPAPHNQHPTATASGMNAGIGGGGGKGMRGQGQGQLKAVVVGMDMELEFDQEVYPIGISLADASIVGMTQRLSRPPPTSSSSYPSGLPLLHPVPESQPVLPCLLRRLLQKGGAFEEAVSLARCHESGPHFMRSLEWLLFTALELEDTRQHDTAKGDQSTSNVGPEGSGLGCSVSHLLSSAAALVRRFPLHHADVVVSVARKTDATLWPPLFTAVGPPSDLLESLLATGALGSAACFLLVIDRLQGTQVAHEQSVRLVDLALDQGEYGLVADLLRFVMPPAELGAFLETRSDQQHLDHRATLDQAQQASATAPPPPPPPPPARQAPVGWIDWILGSDKLPPSPSPSLSSSLDPAPPPPLTLLPPSSSSQPPGSRSAMDRSAMDRSAMDARRLVADHAWRLVEGGELDAWLRLHDSIRSLPGGLQLIMEEAGPRSLPQSSSPHLTARRKLEDRILLDQQTLGDCAKTDTEEEVEVEVEVEVDELLSSISRMASEFPLWAGAEGWDEGVEAKAQEARHRIRALLASCPSHSILLRRWELALSVMLLDGPEVAELKMNRPILWRRMMEVANAGLEGSEMGYLAAILTLADEVALSE